MNSRNTTTTVMVIIWLILCALCFTALNWYKLRPGPVGKLNSFWPQNISYQLDRTHYNLVMFAHPQCGCTYASMIELEKILSNSGNKLKVRIFFYHPKNSKTDWTDGESKRLAMKLPNTEVLEDEGGETARRFGAMTSGQVMVYSPEGNLSYAGGITESRGHVGDNAGSRSIASVITTGKADTNMKHTFGCLLFNEQEMKEYRKDKWKI